jgi:hypothetical protein
MRDDDLDTMSADEFKRKYEDSWVEIKAQSLIKGDKYGTKHNNLKHPENRNISSNPAIRIPGKREIEKKCAEERVQKTKNYIFDAVDVRHKEILDPNEMSIAKLMDLAVKLMPQKVEGEVEHKFTYGDMILRASQNIDAVERVEKEELEDQSEEAELVEGT